MLRSYEFNQRPGAKIEVRHYDEPIYILSESNRDFISELYCNIRSQYPEAYAALCNRYKESIQNTWYFEFQVISGFIKCNCGTFDDKWDIDDNGNFHFEYHLCPLAGECKDENIICHPKEKFSLTESELRIVKLIAIGKKVDEIANRLFISPKTVEAHVYNVNKKLGTNSNAQITDWAHRKNLI